MFSPKNPYLNIFSNLVKNYFSKKNFFGQNDENPMKNKKLCIGILENHLKFLKLK